MDIDKWVALLTAAEAIGEVVVDGVKQLAQQHLSPADYDQLISDWDEDADEAASNAGLDPVTGLPKP